MSFRYLKIIFFLHPRYHPKNNRRHSKKCTKNKYVCFNDVTWLITMKMRMKIKNKLQRYDIYWYFKKILVFILIFLRAKRDRSSGLEMFCIKSVLRNLAKFTGKHLCQGLFLNKVAGLRPVTFPKKETLAQVFSCEICEITKNTFFYRAPPVAASKSVFKRIN